MLIFGTRPEGIKMAPLAHALTDHPELQPLICVSAQHRQMLDQTLALFGLRPDVDLDVMRPNQDLTSLTAQVLTGLGPVLASHHPDAVLVQGDTTTTLCGALAAFYAGIPVGHVEAGLRTGDLSAPFPEELNRRLTTQISRWHFAPTAHNRDNLLHEGVPDRQVTVTGNTVIDALLWMRGRIAAGKASAQTADLRARFARPYILVTGHRRESFGIGFENICRALADIATRHPELDIVYPVHLNPNVQEPVRRLLGGLHNVHLIEPQGYESFVGLMDGALFVLTDSGGVQEEAPSLGKPVLVMRGKTERVEALEAGVRLVGTDTAAIIAGAERLLSDPAHYQAMATAVNPYGDGHAAQRIVATLADALRD